MVVSRQYGKRTVLNDMEMYGDGKCLTVQEVFDGVVEIAEGFEKIIDSHGEVEVVKTVLKKVIWSLEHLRNCVLLNESIDCELSDLKMKVARLEYDKEEKAKLRKKFEEELDQIEEYWKKESKILNTEIIKLQQENQRLRKFQTEDSEEPEAEHENLVDNTVLTLKDVINNQRNQLHAKEAEIYEKSGEIDALGKQLLRTKELGENLRREITATKRENQYLLEEKLELQGRIQDYQRELQLLQNALQEMLGAYNNATDDCQEEDSNVEKVHLPQFTPAQLRRILCEMNNVKLRVKYLEEEVSFYRERSPSLKAETDLAIKLEAEKETETNETLETSEQLSENASDQECDQNSDTEETDNHSTDSSDFEGTMGAEWVTESDVPARSVVDQEIRNRRLMSRRPSAISKLEIASSAQILFEKNIEQKNAQCVYFSELATLKNIKFLFSMHCFDIV